MKVRLFVIGLLDGVDLEIDCPIVRPEVIQYQGKTFVFNSKISEDGRLEFVQAYEYRVEEK